MRIFTSLELVVYVGVRKSTPDVEMAALGRDLERRLGLWHPAWQADLDNSAPPCHQKSAQLADQGLLPCRQLLRCTS